MTQHLSPLLISLFIAVGLSGCGGGGGGSAGNLNAAAAVATQQNVTADAGLARFNQRRAELNLAAVTRNPQLDIAAQGHSDYQAINGVISHYQVPGAPGFTGECMYDVSASAQCAPSKVSRLEAAGYQFSQNSYAFGEVISRTGSQDGAAAAEALIAAIYHRFVIFEPLFRQAGAGAASASGGPTYFTTKFTADGLTGGLGAGQAVVYPVDGQTNVQRNFFSDQEVPDPVPSRNEVGYPISLHADIVTAGVSTVVSVTSFTVRQQGSASTLPVQQLWRAVDANTPRSVAAIVPLDVLAPNTTYEVNFIGTIAGIAHTRSWSFTTGP